MGRLLPILLVFLGVGVGLAAGVFLRPGAGEDERVSVAAEARQMSQDADIGVHELDGQFVVPLVGDDGIGGIVLLHLALEIDQARGPSVAEQAPRLRSAFLQVLFDHANAGGFNGAFTSSVNLGNLRRALLESARKTLGGDVVSGVLITEIIRTGA